MFTYVRFTRSALLSVALVAAPVAASSAQQPLFEWRGRVDGETRIMMRGDQVWTRDVRGRDTRPSRARIVRALPNRNGEVRVQVLNGRGDVDVIQQPSARNGYTTVLRIRDDYARADQYRIVAYWQPAGDVFGRGGYGRGDVYDRDDDRYDDRYGYGRGTVDGLLRWTGAVDDEVEIRIQGRNVDTRTLSGNGTRDVRANLNGRALPRRDVQVTVRERQGRGSVTVLQQPARWNNYTAVIRVRDRQGGFGYYDFDVTW
jgi:hypothetical protein